MHKKSRSEPKADELSLPTFKDANQFRVLETDPSVTLNGVKIESNQLRKVGMALKSSDFDHYDTINPFTQMESNPATSAKQARFMQGCLHNPGSMSGKCPSKEVAREFSHEGG
jgi:hypothetical protein